MSKKLAWQKWFWGDWKSDQALKMVSLAARGLWVEMLGIMAFEEPHGYLKVKNKAIDTVPLLCRLVGGTEGEVAAALQELEDMGIFSRDDDGTIYSRRLIRDEEKRVAQSEYGKLGGNPALGVNYNRPGYLYVAQRSSNGHIKIGISTSPSKRIYKIRKQFPGDQVEIMARCQVVDMGSSEAAAHAFFENARAAGEWFKIDPKALALLTTAMGDGEDALGVHLKVKGERPAIIPRVQSPESRVQKEEKSPPTPRKRGRRIPSVSIPQELVEIGIDREMFRHRVTTCTTTKKPETWQGEIDGLAKLLAEGIPGETVLEVYEESLGSGWQGLAKIIRERAAKTRAGNGRRWRTVAPQAPQIAPGPDLDISARLACLAAALPEGLPELAAWRAAIRSIEETGAEQVDGTLKAIDRKVLTAARKALSAEDAEELKAQLAAAQKQLGQRLPAAEVERVSVQLREQLIRERLSLPVLSLFAPEATT